MILLGAGLITAGALVSGWALHRWRRARAAPPASSRSLPPASASSRPRPLPSAAPPEDPFPRGLPLRVGDVLVRADGVEAWLASAVVLWEDQPMAALFAAPQVGGDVSVYLTRDTDARPWWLAAEAVTGSLPGGEPPSTLEVRGRRFARVRRRPVVLRSPPSASFTSGISAEYTDGGVGRVLVLQVGAEVRAYVGEELAPGMYDVLSAS